MDKSNHTFTCNEQHKYIAKFIYLETRTKTQIICNINILLEVGIAICKWLGYGIDTWQILVWFLMGEKELSLLLCVQTGSADHATFFSNKNGYSYTRGKSNWGMNVVTHSILSQGQEQVVLYLWTPYLHSMQRYKFTLWLLASLMITIKTDIILSPYYTWDGKAQFRN